MLRCRGVVVGGSVVVGGNCEVDEKSIQQNNNKQLTFYSFSIVSCYSKTMSNPTSL